MKVRDIMSRDVIAVTPDTSVNEVAKLMHRHAISGLPVLGASREVVGVITELDIVLHGARLDGPIFVQIFDANIPLAIPSHLRERVRHILGTRAEDVMTRDFQSIGPEPDVAELIDKMVKTRANPWPVIENDELIGIVSRADIIRVMAAELGEDDASRGRSR